MDEFFLSPFLQVVLDRVVTVSAGSCGKTSRLEENIKRVRRTVPMIHAVLDYAEAQEVTDKVTTPWLSRLQNAVYRADELLDELTVESELGESELLSNESSQLANDISNLLEKIETLGTEAYMYYSKKFLLDWQQRSENRGKPVSFAVESSVHGRDEDKEEIVQLLLRDECDGTPQNVPMICILGMDGIGKTTLAQLVYDDDRVSIHFDLKIWVSVTKELDMGNTMKDAIGSKASRERQFSGVDALLSRRLVMSSGKEVLLVLDYVWNENPSGPDKPKTRTGGKSQFSGMDALLSQLQDMLCGKKYLLVVDDALSPDPYWWEKLRTLFGIGLEGSKVIVTGRIVSFTGTAFVYHLTGLAEDDCWALFKQQAFGAREEEQYPHLLPLAKGIVKKCGGVPLAAKLLGSIMRSKRRESEWLLVQNSELWNIGKSQLGILPALRLSYIQLPWHLKRCFAFCSIFPKSYEIDKEKLIHLWIAAGLIPLCGGTAGSIMFREDRNRSRPEDIGKEYFNNLLQMSFFEVVEKDCSGSATEVKMHDLVHDLAKSIVRNEFTILQSDYLPSELHLSRHISIAFQLDEFPEILYYSKHLHTLLLLSGGDLSDASFVRFKSLRALDLSCSGITELHQSIGDLVLLKYLDLSHNQINALPDTICRLLSLQMLNLSGCYNLKELPDLMVLKMRRLRHLNVTGCLHLARLPRHIGDLRELQTLQVYIVGDDDGRGISELGLLDLHGELKIMHLEKVNTRLEAQKAVLWGKKKLESLGLYWEDIDDEGVVESNINRFRKRARPSSSTPSQGVKHDAAIREEVLEGLQPHPNLKQLLVQGYLGTRFPHWPLPNLTVVDLSYCKRCRLLPTLGNLPVLKILSLSGMNEVERIGVEFYGKHMGRPFFPLLKELALRDFPNLEHWLWLDCPDAFPIISKLVIKKCPKLKNIPSFSSLKHLELQDCSLLILRSSEMSLSGEVLVNCYHLTSLEILSCSTLHSLPSKLEILTALKSLTIGRCEQLSSLPEGLQNLKTLEYLEIFECHGLTALPDNMIDGLNSLRNISIENCNNLLSLPLSVRSLTALECLTVECCPNLAYLPETLQYLPRLGRLTIVSCPRLSSLPKVLQITTLRRLEIRDCPGLRPLLKHIENLSSLESLTISDHDLKCLPDSLENLSMDFCSETERLVKPDIIEQSCSMAYIRSSKGIKLPPKRGSIKIRFFDSFIKNIIRPMNLRGSKKSSFLLPPH